MCRVEDDWGIEIITIQSEVSPRILLYFDETTIKVVIIDLR